MEHTGDIKYKSFVIKEDAGGNRFRVEYAYVQGQREGGGTWGDLYKVEGRLVLMKCTGRPIAIYEDLKQFSMEIENQYKIQPEIV